LRIVKNDSYSKEDENDLLKETKMRLGSAIKINFEYVNTIERTQNGKFRFVVSKLNQAELLKNIAD
jgi:phenylacetate-coenzyme A ligase PaaK-like adenylate-forming protein